MSSKKSGKKTFRLDSVKYSRHNRKKDTRGFYNKSSTEDDKLEKLDGGSKLSISKSIVKNAYKTSQSMLSKTQSLAGGIKHVKFNSAKNMKKSDSNSFRSSERKNQYFNSKSIARAKREKRLGIDEEENSPDILLPIGSDHTARILAGEEPLKLKRSETSSNILKNSLNSEPKKSKSSFLGRILKGTRNIITRRKSNKKISK